jgi:molybdenum cofactor biosynthesis enzyme MoaA
VKINVVLLHGLLRSEVDDFFAMAREMPVKVRFIERMPTAAPRRRGTSRPRGSASGSSPCRGCARPGTARRPRR